MNTLYKTLLLLCITFGVMKAEANIQNKKGKYTRTKDLSNSYKTNSNFNLYVDNTFGEVKVETWDKDEVSYQINIISNGDNLEAVQERIDQISIELLESKSKLRLETNLGDQSNQNRTFTRFVKDLINWNITKVNNHIEINYIIHVPKYTNLEINNDYGFIYLGEIKGQTKLISTYGGIVADALLNESNSIDIDYASKSDITHLRKGSINMNYSSLYLHHVGEIDLVADYCTTKIDSAKTIDFNIDYGSLNLEKVQSIHGNCDYVQLKIGEVSNNLDLNISYGGLRLNRLSGSFTSADIQSDYAIVKIGVDTNNPFKIDINADYTGLNGLNDFHVIERTEGDYKGYNLNKETNKKISIDSGYGSVTFFPAYFD